MKDNSCFGCADTAHQIKYLFILLIILTLISFQLVYCWFKYQSSLSVKSSQILNNAIILEKHNDNYAALDLCKYVSKKDPDLSPVLYVTLYTLYIKMHDYRQAKDTLKYAKILFPHSKAINSLSPLIVNY